jgi:carbamoyl-phosphate synthase large subunit
MTAETAPSRPGRDGPLNLLITCGGKWVGFVVQFREAMKRCAGHGTSRIIVASSDDFTPAGCFADAAAVVPPIADEHYVDALLEVCVREAVTVVIPMIDLDLSRLTPHLDRFAKLGAHVVCPPPDVVELCFDKLRFARFVESIGLRHPVTVEADALGELTAPVFHKRRFGYGSIGAGVCDSLAAARALARTNPDLIFQDVIHAREISVDAYVNRDGRCVIAVQRLRDKVVAGEAYKSHTVRLPTVSQAAEQMIAALASRGLRGPLNLQVFDTDPPTILEVNARLGSACVLSNVATGGRLFDAVLAEATGGTAGGRPEDYTVGLALNRFLGDVFHQGSKLVAIKPS